MSDTAPVLEALLPELLAVLRRTQAHTLEGAWELGALLDEAAAESDIKTLVNDAAKSLAAAGCDISSRNLNAYRDLHRAYEREQLPALLEQGFTLTHLQVLAGLEPELRLAIESDLQADDGQVPSVRVLKQMVQERRREQTRAVSMADADCSREAAANDKPLRPAVIEAEATRTIDAPRIEVAHIAPLDESDDDGDGEIDATGSQAAADLSPEERQHRAGLTAAVASGPKGFTISPLKVIKAADNVGIKMLGQSGDCFLALDEVARFGYDSERSLKNFLEAAQSLDATLASYEQVLPEMRRRLRSALGALHIEG